MVGLCFFYAGKVHERLFDRRGAVTAVHAVDFDFLFHSDSSCMVVYCFILQENRFFVNTKMKKIAAVH